MLHFKVDIRRRVTESPVWSHRLQLPPPWARRGDSISCLTSADKFNRRGGTAAINVLASSRGRSRTISSRRRSGWGRLLHVGVEEARQYSPVPLDLNPYQIMTGFGKCVRK